MKTKKHKYDIFISYRHEGGFETARLLADRLKTCGYRVFLDHSSMRSGDFSKQIYEIIDGCKDVFVIVSAGCFSRAVEQQRRHLESGAEGTCPPDPKDWVRLEVAHAIKHDKNVIPVFLRNEKLPDSQELPEDIAQLPNQHGFEVSQKLFDALVQDMRKNLKSKPSMQRWLIPAAIIILLFALVVSWQIFKPQEPKSFPVTKQEEKILQEVCANILLYNTNQALILSAEQKFFDRCADLISTQDKKARYTEVLSEYLAAKATISNVSVEPLVPLESLRDDIASTPLDRGDFMALGQIVELEKKHALDSIEQMKDFFSQDSLISDADLQTLVRLNKEFMVTLSAEQVRNGTMDFLAPARKDAIKETIAALQSITQIPYTNVPWTSDRDHLKQEMERILKRMGEIHAEISALVGNNRNMLRSEEDIAVEMLKAGGMSDEEARKTVATINRISVKQNVLDTKEKDLEDLKNKLEQTRLRAREKFAPNEKDRAGILWGKMMRLNTLRIYDGALECLDAFEKKAGDSELDFNVYVPRVRDFIKQIDHTGINHGLVVAGFEPPATSHAIYQIGDIVTAMNDLPCIEVDDLENYRNKEESTTNTVTIYRQDEQGNFKPIKADTVKNQPKVAFMEISEKLSSKIQNE